MLSKQFTIYIFAHSLLRTHLTSYLKSSAALGDLVHEQVTQDFPLPACGGLFDWHKIYPYQAVVGFSWQNISSPGCDNFFDWHKIYPYQAVVVFFIDQHILPRLWWWRASSTAKEISSSPVAEATFRGESHTHRDKNKETQTQYTHYSSSWFESHGNLWKPQSMVCSQLLHETFTKFT